MHLTNVDGPACSPRLSTTLGKLSLQNTCYNLLTWIRLNCRLPQTPRTPTSAAAHYFDDIFSRPGRPPKGGRRPSRLLRRSSTSRSIGNQSDFAASVNDTGDEETEDAMSANGTNDHMEENFTTYIANQLNRVRSSATLGAYEDEFSTEVDHNGTNTNGTNRH